MGVLRVPLEDSWLYMLALSSPFLFLPRSLSPLSIPHSSPSHRKYGLHHEEHVFGHMRTAKAQISLRIRAVWSGLHWSLTESLDTTECMIEEQRLEWDLAPSQDGSPHILRMLKGTFSLDAAHYNNVHIAQMTYQCQWGISYACFFNHIGMLPTSFTELGP